MHGEERAACGPAAGIGAKIGGLAGHVQASQAARPRPPDHHRAAPRAGGRHRRRAVVADTRDALALREATYPAVFYIPREDADLALLERTEHATYCPYKGDAAYYSIPGRPASGANAVWTYEAPYEAVSEIKDQLAFYPDRVDAIDEQPL